MRLSKQLNPAAGSIQGADDRGRCNAEARLFVVVGHSPFGSVVQVEAEEK